MSESKKGIDDNKNNSRNIVIIGGGIQGVSVAYHIAKSSKLPPNSNIKILEATEIAHAASGKGGGFMAKTWGDGGVTETLHRLSFELYESLAEELQCTSYRKLPVLSVGPSANAGKSNKKLDSMMPGWLDGNYNRVSPLGLGDDTAQITPSEFTRKALDAVKDKVSIVYGTCTGIQLDDSDDSSKVTAVLYQTADGEDAAITCDSAIVSAGPWSCSAEDWFPTGTISLPMEGVKSTSIVWDPPSSDDVDATALFCGEDDRYSTHLEVYPRPDNTIYICGIGGSEYIPKDALKKGAFREENACLADESRVDAATESFKEMSRTYRAHGNVGKVQACMRPCPPDALPYMGEVFGVQGAYVNAGHNCWGIAWAPVCGKAMAELVLTGSCSCVDLSPFDPNRYTPGVGKRGGRGRKRLGMDVGEQW